MKKVVIYVVAICIIFGIGFVSGWFVFGRSGGGGSVATNIRTTGNYIDAAISALNKSIEHYNDIRGSNKKAEEIARQLRTGQLGIADSIKLLKELEQEERRVIQKLREREGG